MNLLSKTFGATGKISVDLTADGLVVQASDTEKLSDQSINETINVSAVVDAIVTMLGSPSWAASLGAMLKAEIAALAAAP